MRQVGFRTYSPLRSVSRGLVSKDAQRCPTTIDAEAPERGSPARETGRPELALKGESPAREARSEGQRAGGTNTRKGERSKGTGTGGMDTRKGDRTEGTGSARKVTRKGDRKGGPRRFAEDMVT